MAQSIVADFHCHTLASSHAYSTVTEVARQAAAMGMLAVGCTDHGIGIEDAPHLWHFLNLRILPPYIDGVRVKNAAELRAELSKHKVGEEVEITLNRIDSRTRRETTFTVKVTLVESRGN